MLPIPLQCLLAPAPGALLANWSTNGRDGKARKGGPLVDSDTDDLRKLMTESNSKIKNEKIKEMKNEQESLQTNYQGTFIVLYFIVIFCNTVKIKLKQTKY